MHWTSPHASYINKGCKNNSMKRRKLEMEEKKWINVVYNDENFKMNRASICNKYFDSDEVNKMEEE